MSDLGRRFLITRVLELMVELDADDINSRPDGESASETALAIADGIPLVDWSIVATDVEAL